MYCPIRPKGDISKDMSASEWKIDIKELEAKITPRSKIIVLNTPHNPIGKVFSHEELTEIGALAAKHNLLIISDEVVSINLMHVDEFMPQIKLVFHRSVNSDFQFVLYWIV